MANKDESGFTLIEVLLSLAILAIGLLALGLMQAHFVEGNSRSRQLVHATDIAESKIEELTNISHYDPTDNDSPLETGKEHREQVYGYPLAYEVVWEVEEEDDHLAFDITVEWEAGGIDRNVSFHWRKGI